MILPLASSFVFVLIISPSCVAHYFSVKSWKSIHLICNDPTYAFVGYICTTWVILTSLSFSFAVIQAVVNYFLGANIAQKIYNAKTLEYEESPDIYDLIDDLAFKIGVDSPYINLIESSKPQIFTFGGNGDSYIFLSVGLVETLTTEELKAAFAHELSHLKNHDTLIRSFASSLKIVSLFNLFGFLVEPALSRDREFQSDEEASQLVSSKALISALLKLSHVSSNASDSFLLGIMSFSQFVPKLRVYRLFSRHPSIEERIRRLLDLNI
jgi:heat shock protein HtpX